MNGLERFAGRRLVLAASTGGHLTQLVRIADRIAADERSLWIASDDAHSRSLLHGREVLFVPRIVPRDVRAVIRVSQLVHAHLAASGRAHQFAGAVSTGAAVAVSALAATKRLGIPGVYVESFSRTSGPSLSGRIVRRLRLAATMTQHSSWAGPGWPLTDSVLGDFRAIDTDSRTQRPSLFVTLGTIVPYRFDRLIDTVLCSGLADRRTVWQTGATARRDLPGTANDWLATEEFDERAQHSDVVVTHAGVGTLVQLLELGVRPIILPRLAAHREHVDDHQCQIARYLADRDLAHVLRPGADTVAQIIAATGYVAAPR